MGATFPASRAMPAHVPRVLVVDPDADTRALYRESLGQVGCEVVEAADGPDALVQALADPPSLIVTETRLPVFDGYALCDILRRDSATRAIPIVVVTAESGNGQLARARGVDAVFVKPAAIDMVVSEIQRLLAPDERPHPVADAAAPSAPAAPMRSRKALTKAHLRCETITPPLEPPDLYCPSCDRALRYERSYIGGVSGRHAEQWDNFSCACGIFEYRHRTRKLRHVR